MRNRLYHNKYQQVMSSDRFRFFGKTRKAIKGKEDAVREKAHCVGKPGAGKGTAAAGQTVATNRIVMLSFLRAFHVSSPFMKAWLAARGAASEIGDRRSECGEIRSILPCSVLRSYLSPD